jgi:hypothetical protein
VASEAECDALMGIYTAVTLCGDPEENCDGGICGGGACGA